MTNTVLKSALALYGGTPARPNPAPPMYPGGMMIGAEEEAAVLDVIRSKQLFRYYGPDPKRQSVVEQFEKAFAAYMGVPHTQAVNSGNSALITALKGAGIEKGDEVIVPAFAWIATVAAVLLVGGVPVIAEVDESLTLDPEAAARCITPRTRALVAVHMRGNGAQMEPLMVLARQHGLKVIEDTAQACGGSYRGQKLGTIGDVGAFSFQINKVMTTGEGGAVITRDERIFGRARTWHDGSRTWEKEGGFQPVFAGENYRMPELSGAVGLAQLGKLDTIVGKMRATKAAIVAGTEHLNLHRRALPDAAGDAALAFVFYAPSAALAQEAVRALRAENVPANNLYVAGRTDRHVADAWGPIVQAAGAPFYGDRFPRSLDLLGRAINVDVNPLFTEEDTAGVAAGVEKVVQALF